MSTGCSGRRPIALLLTTHLLKDGRDVHHRQIQTPRRREGLTDAEIISWEVAVGDCVEINQTLCEVETAKSAVELPSPVAGVVETLHAAVGDIVDVGTVIVSIRIGGPGGPGAAAPETRRRRTGSGTCHCGRRCHGRRRRGGGARAGTEGADPGGHRPECTGRAPPAPRPRGELPASPSRPAGGEVALVADTRVPIRGVRRATAAAMTESAFTAPHVTEWLAVDVTATTELVATLRADPRWVGLRINPMLLVAKALLMALEKYPGPTPGGMSARPRSSGSGR